MDFQKIEAIIDTTVLLIADISKKEMAEYGQVRPFVGICQNDQLIVIPLLWFSTDEEKSLTFQMINRLLKEHKPDIAFFVCESWVVRVADQGEMGGLTPSEHPDRVEGLVILAEYDYGSDMIFCDIERDGDTVTLKDPVRLPPDGYARSRIFDGVFLSSETSLIKQ